MDIITDAQLLDRIESFLKQHSWSPSRFGREAMADAALVFQLRAGARSMSLKNAAKVVEFIDSYKPNAPAEAA